MHVLSLALLFAQLGMVVHANSHLNSDPHAIPTPGQICGQCASFAPMQNMVGGGALLVLALPVSHDRVLNCDAIVSAPHRAFSAFRSRAPPVSL